MKPAPRGAAGGLRQRGAATVEFYIVAFFVFIPIVMATIQLGLFMVANNTVNAAALMVARAGAASGVDRTHMRHAYATGLTPLYASTGLRLLSGGVNKEVTSGNYAVVHGAAYGRAWIETGIPYNRIQVLNPTPASFVDWGETRPGVGRIIPVTNMDVDRGAVGIRSRQTRAESLLLKVQVNYCFEMVIPVIDELIANIMLLSTPAASLPCLLEVPAVGKRRGVLITSQAVVRMTVPPEQARFP